MTSTSAQQQILAPYPHSSSLILAFNRLHSVWKPPYNNSSLSKQQLESVMCQHSRHSKPGSSLASQPYFSEWCTHAHKYILRGRGRKYTSGNCRQVFVSATQNLVVQSGARCHVIIHNVYNFHVIVGSRLQQLTA